MCGILGQINYALPIQKNDEVNFKQALDLLQHRGPDDSDIYRGNSLLFGHRRLSIIDLDSHAKQPMISNCGNYILVFNGEIYNFQEIKINLIEKGYQFNTLSDTEVLLNSYIEYGIDCLQQLIGMFAFSIYDKSKDVTYIVRDRLGIKPLYYTHDKDSFIFSSEIKSILRLTTKPKELNIEAVSSYFSFRYPILNDTFFMGISSLPPAHYIKLTHSEFETIEYWNIAGKFKEQENDKGEEFYIKKTQELLESSVKYRMISDVPIGAFLSGGVDSSIITAIMAKNSEKPIQTFTIGFHEDGYNEFEYAKIVSEQYHTNHMEILLSSNDYIYTMEKLIGYKDSPLSVPNEVPLYLMSKELKKSITVVLSGEGADEIFGGYGRIFRSPYDLDRMQNIDKLNLSNDEKTTLCNKFIKKYGVKIFNSEIDHFMKIYSYTSLEEKKSLLDESIDLTSIENKLIDKFLQYFNELNDSSYYNKLMYTFEKIHLLGLLQRVDTATMSASVEARVPFVDHRLVEFACTIPFKYKLKWNNAHAIEESKTLLSDEISEFYDTPKYILKKSFESILPNEILYRKKMGFPVPLNNWFGGHFNEYAKKILLSDAAKSRNLYNTSHIEKILRNNQLAKNHALAMKIWMLINVELFMKKYFKKEN